MPVKRKISKAEYEALSDEKKEFYIENKDRKGEYVVDMDADFNKELTTALDAVKNDNKTLTDKLAETETALTAAKAEKAPKDGSVAKDEHESIVKSLNTKLAKAETDSAAAITKRDAFIRKTLIDSKASELAGKISKAPKLLLPHIKARLSANLDGDEPATVVLDADGKPSAYTLADLEQEFVANKDFADIIVGSKATGGNPQNAPGGGNALLSEKPAPLSSLSGEALVAHMKATHPDLNAAKP